jgi:hypothetical protein
METVSNRSTVLRWIVLAAALALLNTSLTFVNVWPTLAVQLTGALSLEAALVVLAVVVARQWFGTASRRLLRSLAVISLLLVVGRYVDVTARSLYGREINLYWDARYMPDVGAMLAFVAEPWSLAAVAGGVILLPLLIYALLRWALGCVSDATHAVRARRLLTALAGGVLVFALAQRLDERVPEIPRIADPVTAVYFRQARQLMYELSGAGLRALPPAVPIASSLTHVRGADVYLVFIESYGAVSWDRAAFRGPLAASRARLEGDIRHTGRSVVSGRIESPTFGGESWLAHISLLSGTEVRDQDTNVRLMAQQRDTLVSVFSRQGYRTLAVMPGLQRAWPEGRFYGFDQIYGSTELAYRGPPFGWWDVTDQFVLARLDALVGQTPKQLVASRRPLFVFFPTISTHTPFTPTPPYQADWTRILTPAPYDPDVLDLAWSQPPDWLDLGPGYVQALEYVHATLGGYLRVHADRDLVMILVGDHQPPAAVSGADASWDVPVHIIASRGEVLERLRRHGFRDGLEPSAQSLMKIHALLPVLLDAFGDE